MAGATGPNAHIGQDSGADHIDAPELRLFVMALFFIFGGITSLNDVIIPKLKELFTLNYTQAMLVQFCFFTAYAVIGIPGAQLVKRIGYMRGAVVGLLTMMAGCLLFIPASRSADLSAVPARPVRARERRGDCPGRLQPADLAAWPGEDSAQPADFCPGVQFAGHHGVSLSWLDPDPRQSGHSQRRSAHRQRSRRLPDSRKPGDRQRLSRPCGCACHRCRSGLDCSATG